MVLDSGSGGSKNSGNQIAHFKIHVGSWRSLDAGAAQGAHAVPEYLLLLLDGLLCRPNTWERVESSHVADHATSSNIGVQRRALLGEVPHLGQLEVLELVWFALRPTHVEPIGAHFFLV